MKLISNEGNLAHAHNFLHTNDINVFRCREMLMSSNVTYHVKSFLQIVKWLCLAPPVIRVRFKEQLQAIPSRFGDMNKNKIIRSRYHVRTGRPSIRIHAFSFTDLPS